MHVVHNRRHNVHAQALAAVNPHWSDEKIFQEARRLNIAEFTHIVYNEFLETLIGKPLMEYFELQPKKSGFSTYNERVDPGSIQAVIVAASRYGHSQKSPKFDVLLQPQDKHPSYSFQLRDSFFETSSVRFGHTDGLIRGMTTTRTMRVDSHFTVDLKDFLYHIRTDNFGRDLPALNIQRGRDHGIPGYVHYLEYCYDVQVKEWSDLYRFIPCEVVDKLRTHYKHVQDLDLFVGGVSEFLLPSGAVGPTFGCLIGIQFYNFKFGDRFFYEHGDHSGSFSIEQLDNMRAVSSLSNTICKTTGVESMQKNPVIIESEDNPRYYCKSYPEINYDLWRE
jgi:peroxidase